MFVRGGLLAAVSSCICKHRVEECVEASFTAAPVIIGVVFDFCDRRGWRLPGKMGRTAR